MVEQQTNDTPRANCYYTFFVGVCVAGCQCMRFFNSNDQKTGSLTGQSQSLWLYVCAEKEYEHKFQSQGSQPSQQGSKLVKTYIVRGVRFYHVHIMDIM